MTKDEPSSDAKSRAGQLPAIDLAAYRTGDFAERLGALFSVPEALRKVLSSTVFLAALFFAVCVLAQRYFNAAWLPLLASCAYALLIGIVLGMGLGFVRVVAAALQNIEAILDIVLEITGKVAGDYDRIQAGAARLPTGGELVERVYEGVAIPVMHGAVTKPLGVLGPPLIWVYRRTIGSAVRSLIRRVNRSAERRRAEMQLEQAAAAGVVSIAKYSETINAYTNTAMRIVSSIGGTIRWFALLPLYITFTLVIVLAIVPLFIELWVIH